jgi:hypothetical protein
MGGSPSARNHFEVEKRERHILALSLTRVLQFRARDLCSYACSGILVYLKEYTPNRSGRYLEYLLDDVSISEARW